MENERSIIIINYTGPPVVVTKTVTVDLDLVVTDITGTALEEVVMAVI